MSNNTEHKCCDNNFQCPQSQRASILLHVYPSPPSTPHPQINLRVSTEVQKECKAWLRSASVFQQHGSHPQADHPRPGVQRLDLLPSLNIVQDGRRFNKCTLQNESEPILTSRPPSLSVSIPYDKVKQTAWPMAALLGFLWGANRLAAGRQSQASGLPSGEKHK